MNAKLIVITYSSLLNNRKSYLACSADKVQAITKELTEQSTEIDKIEVCDLYINVSLIDEIKQ